MLVLGFDVETTGLDPKSDQIIEIGAVLWDTDRSQPVKMYSDLVKLDGRDSLSPEITEITGIESEDLAKFGIPLEKALLGLADIAKDAQFIVAHNASFDRGFLENAIKQSKQAQALKELAEMKWIDTINDIPYPEKITTRKLGYLATEHNFLNPFAHRAVFDVLTMLKVLQNYNIAEIVELASSPTIALKAVVSFEEKDKARNRGYRWDRENRMWTKNIKQKFLANEKAQCDFKLVELSSSAP